MMLAAYVTMWLITSFSVNPYLTPLFVIPIFFALGVFMQWALVRHVVKGPHIASLLLLFGVWLVMQNFAYAIWTGNVQSITTPFTLMAIPLGPIRISFNRLVVFFVSIITLILLQQFLTRTYIGKAIRAISEDADAAKLVGVNTERIMMVAFGLGTALAGLAGSLMSLIFAFDPDFGHSHLLKSFCIIVLGGMESFVGVALGALVLALTESFSILLIKPAMQDFVSFVLLVVVLVVMPNGLIGLIRRR
ncbi:MAG: hypothetical protein A2Z04_02480 [Chloroflexi bacterium RBG_16_57_9]|nr:MAG: hypothetical protein A2Z04_02480 [Chloroflexi bacterium RBG_16_57_9]